MNSQPFRRWRDRFMYAQDAVDRAAAETNEFKEATGTSATAPPAAPRRACAGWSTPTSWAAAW